MADYWDSLSREEGFNGIKVIYRFDETKKMEAGRDVFFYEPIYSGWGSVHSRAIEKVKNIFCEKLKFERKTRIYTYSKIWEQIIKKAGREKNTYSGAFVAYDETPRRGRKAIVVQASKPDLFCKYMMKLLKISEQKNKEYVFLTAWNEWGEGAYLEPDETNGYAYLEALKRAIDACLE